MTSQCIKNTLQKRTGESDISVLRTPFRSGQGKVTSQCIKNTLQKRTGESDITVY